GASSLVRDFAPGGAIVSTVASPSTCQPSMPSSLAIVRTSASCGTFLKVDAPPGSSAAASSGRAAFLAPLIGILPVRRAPPSTTILSIRHDGRSTNAPGHQNNGGAPAAIPARRSGDLDRQLALDHAHGHHTALLDAECAERDVLELAGQG